MRDEIKTTCRPHQRINEVLPGTIKSIIGFEKVYTLQTRPPSPPLERLMLAMSVYHNTDPACQTD